MELISDKIHTFLFCLWNKMKQVKWVRWINVKKARKNSLVFRKPYLHLEAECAVNHCLWSGQSWLRWPGRGATDCFQKQLWAWQNVHTATSCAALEWQVLDTGSKNFVLSKLLLPKGRVEARTERESRLQHCKWILAAFIHPSHLEEEGNG